MNFLNRLKDLIYGKSIDNKRITPTEQIQTFNRSENLEKYPEEYLIILNDELKMSSLIKQCYSTQFDFLDLSLIHKEIFQNSPEYLENVEKLQTKKIPLEVFGEIGKPEFWVTNYKNLLYVFNGEKLFPIDNVSNNLQVGWIISILFIPEDITIQSNSRLIINEYRLFELVASKISDTEVLRNFLIKLQSFSCYSNNDKWVWGSKIPFKNKLGLLFEMNKLPFMVANYVLHLNLVEYNFDKFIELLFNHEEKRYLEIIQISETSKSILTLDEIKTILSEKLNSKREFLELFKIDSIQGYLEKFETRSLISDIYNLDIDFHYHSSESSYNKKYKNIEFERKSKNELIRFKKDYYKEIKTTIREFENEIRIKRGYKLVGTFTQETILFEKLKTHFKSHKIVSQGSPKWLKLQRIDIYFPELNIGIEYHGEQHFIPVDYFGGEDGLKKNIERDERKMKLCFENGCKLFVVDKNYKFETLCYEIEIEIKNRTSQIGISKI